MPVASREALLRKRAEREAAKAAAAAAAARAGAEGGISLPGPSSSVPASSTGSSGSSQFSQFSQLSGSSQSAPSQTQQRPKPIVEDEDEFFSHRREVIGKVRRQAAEKGKAAARGRGRGRKRSASCEAEEESGSGSEREQDGACGLDLFRAGTALDSSQKKRRGRPTRNPHVASSSSTASHNTRARRTGSKTPNPSAEPPPIKRQVTPPPVLPDHLYAYMASNPSAKDDIIAHVHEYSQAQTRASRRARRDSSSSIEMIETAYKPSTPTHVPLSDNSDNDNDKDSAPCSPTSPTIHPTTPADNGPIIEILIRSRLPDFPNAHTLFKRRYKQTLGLVFKGWRTTHEIPQSKDVVFVHRGAQVYEFATLKGIGVVGEEGTKVVIEALEKEEWERREREGILGEGSGWADETSISKILGDSDDDSYADEAGGNILDDSEDEGSAGDKLRFVLRAKGKPEIKLLIGKKKTVGSLVERYREMAGIGKGVRLRVVYEGENWGVERRIEELDLEEEEEEDEEVLVDVLVG